MTILWRTAEAWLMQVSRRLVELSRASKVALMLALDASLCVIAVWIAFSLRLGVWDLTSRPVMTSVIVCLTVWLPVFVGGRVYRSVTRFVGSRTMFGIAASCSIMALAITVVFSIFEFPDVPRTIGVLQPIIFAALLIVSRISARYVVSDLLNRGEFVGKTSTVLIFGAGTSGRQLALSLMHEPGMTLRGFVDDDTRLSGQRLDGVKIYPNKDLGSLVRKLDIDTVLLAIPKVSRQHHTRIVRGFAQLPVHVRTLPAIGELVGESISADKLREIEVTDLLGRDPVPPNHLLLHRTITSRVVMVTGAGGSIGSELCRQISSLKPASIILVEMTEHSLYQIENELKEAQEAGTIDISISIKAELANISDPLTVYRLFERWRPDTVFHAAAYKHVPLVEENVIAGLLNNIFGTLRCALQAERVGVKNFILVSTDKAVRPTNVMGASKRVCELILQGLAAENGETRFAMVRFGNVLGSSGSVVPRFQRQIREGGPVTLTHRDVTRYFMTIPEAAQLVIQAGAMAEGGDVFLLDMGEPIRIIDLARTMIHLSGLSVRDSETPGGQIEIREVGLRRGEKLYEELLIGDSAQPTSHPRIMRAVEQRLTWRHLKERLDVMQIALDNGCRMESLKILRELVPEYKGVAESAVA